MKRKVLSQGLAILLSCSMIFGMSTTAFAETNDSVVAETVQEQLNETTTEVVGDEVVETKESENEVEEVEDSSQETESSEDVDTNEDDSGDVSNDTVNVVSDYSTFLADLKVLESYAVEYAADHSDTTANALIINYIRTGVEKYTKDSWQIMAGAENKEFTAFVQEKDVQNKTSASDLKNITEFNLPNGNTVDFQHMFGTMDIISYTKGLGGNQDTVTARSDMGGWAGDICDLLSLSVERGVSGEDIDSVEVAIKSLFGIDITEENSHSFSQTDIYGDLDGLYLMSELDKSNDSIASLVEAYFTDTLTDANRADYFLVNRLNSVRSKNGIRAAVLNSYKGNTLIQTLEASRGLSDVSETMRIASCYVFADYLYDLAGNDETVDPEPEPDPDPEPKPMENDFYSVFSSASTTLAPGVEQTIKYALTADDKQIVYYTATVDVNRDDVNIYANYHNNDASSWAMSRVSDQMAAAQQKHSDPNDEANYIENYNAVVGTNADFYNMSTGKPSGALVMEGKEYNGSGGENFFAILKDGTPVIGSAKEYDSMKDQIKEAVGGSIFLVRDGKSAVTTSQNYYVNRASRTCIGITADNKVVMMVLDGRQEPFSAGGSAEELAQIMLDAGCVIAINLDGGGSSTFDAKQEGSDEVSVVNRPSDGYERSVSSSLLVVSTAKRTNEFDHALISTDTDYLTVNSSLQLDASGVSSTGNAAILPDNLTWHVVDETVGTISDGVFTANKKGSTEIQLLAGDTVVGSKIINVVVPDKLLFTNNKMDVIYGEEAQLPIAATYNGNAVTINTSDIVFQMSNSKAGSMNGFGFTGKQESGVKNVRVTALLKTDYSISATMNLAMYSANEAKFDFDTALVGDRSLAWNRDVSNATLIRKTKEDVETFTYEIEKAEQPMVTDYTFALDMQTVEIPEKLNDLVKMVAGGDLESATAWNFLLQLAERVSALTNVEIKVQFDKNVDVDITKLTVVNDYFELKSAEVDKDTNIMTMKVSWIKQTEAISADTANPIVIMSGIKLTPKENANWDNNNRLKITNTGELSYDIYLRASSLYAMANQKSFQDQYGIYPYVNPDLSSDAGGHMVNMFKTFEDVYTLDKTIKDGWAQYNGNIYFFKDNEPLTGIQKLPGYQDEGKEYYYDLGTEGIYTGKLSGLFELSGDKYYAVNGVLQNSWRVITNTKGEDEYYYFSRHDYKAVNGAQTISGYNYVFENYILKQGDWLHDEKGIRFVWAGKIKRNEWFTVDGKQYFAYADTYLATGIKKTLNHERTGEEVYVFDENGAWLNDLNGFYDYNGATYLAKDGIRVAYPGLVEVDGAYYYFNSSHTMVKGKSYYISKTNGLMKAGSYEFDADGKMVVKTPEEMKNGIVKEGTDTWYYYVDDVKTYAGLIQIDGDYYYVTSHFQVIHGRSYFVSKTNGLMASGTYEFDADGKMVIENPGEVKNGIVKESDGTWYYYVNGIKTYAGLIQIDGDYYYVTSSFKVVHDQKYFISKTNGLMPNATYEFDADGKMIIKNPEDMKNGIVRESADTWYYYVDDVKTYAGLIQIDGDYYYVTSHFQVIHGRSYYVSKTNGLMPAGTYEFDSDGKMVIENPGEVKDGIVKESDGTWYYYVNGVKTYAGLIQIDGDYYYVTSSFKVVHDQKYFISKSNGLMPNATYEFDSEGKMIIQ